MVSTEISRMKVCSHRTKPQSKVATIRRRTEMKKTTNYSTMQGYQYQHKNFGLGVILLQSLLSAPARLILLSQYPNICIGIGLYNNMHLEPETDATLTIKPQFYNLQDSLESTHLYLMWQCSCQWAYDRSTLAKTGRPFSHFKPLVSSRKMPLRAVQHALTRV